MNPYRVLGVNKNATDEEIKEAWRELVKKNHPDLNGGNDEKIKEINEAYTFLSNLENRMGYDETGIFPGSEEAEVVKSVVTIFKMILFESTNNRTPIKLETIVQKLTSDIEDLYESIEKNEMLLIELKKNSKVIRRKKGSRSKVDCFKTSYELLRKEVEEITQTHKKNVTRIEKVLALVKEYEQVLILRQPATTPTGLYYGMTDSRRL